MSPQVRIINSSPGGGSGPALAESGIPSGRVVAVGFVFDSRTEPKNEASQHAYSTRIFATNGVAA